MTFHTSIQEEVAVQMANYPERQILCCGCIEMRTGMIIMLVWRIVGALFLIVEWMQFYQVAQSFPVTGYGEIAGTVPSFISQLIIAWQIQSWLGSRDTSTDRLLLVKAMKLGIVNDLLLSGVYLAVVVFDFDKFNMQDQDRIMGALVGRSLGVCLNMWYVHTAKLFYTEKAKFETRS